MSDRIYADLNKPGGGNVVWLTLPKTSADLERLGVELADDLRLDFWMDNEDAPEDGASSTSLVSWRGTTHVVTGPRGSIKRPTSTSRSRPRPALGRRHERIFVTRRVRRCARIRT
jgi:hypothetical protein